MDLPKLIPDFFRIRDLFVTCDPAYILVAFDAGAVWVNEDYFIPLVPAILPDPVAV